MTTQAPTCQHQRDVHLLTQRGLARRTANATSLAALLSLIDEAKTACQAECGVASPYHGEQVRPRDYCTPVEDHPFDQLADMARATRAAVRGLGRRLTHRRGARREP